MLVGQHVARYDSEHIYKICMLPDEDALSSPQAIFQAILRTASCQSPIHRIHTLSIVLTCIYRLSASEVALLANLATQTPQMFNLLVQNSINHTTMRPLAVVALRLLYYCAFTQDAVDAFLAEHAMFVETIASYAAISEQMPSLDHLQVVPASLASLASKRDVTRSSTRLVQDPFLSATFVSDATLLPVKNQEGCDLLADAASTVLAHMALLSPQARKALQTESCCRNLIDGLRYTSFLEILAPYRLINILNTFLYICYAKGPSECADYLHGLIYNRNLQNILLKLGSIVFLNNENWYLLYESSNTLLKKSASGVYSLETNRVVYESNDLFFLKQQLIRFISICSVVG